MTTDTVPILYSFRRCPYAMRARLALALAGVAVEHREIVLRDKPAPMLVASPKATVPILVLTAEVLEESLDIMHWSLAQPCFTQDEQRLLELNDGKFKQALDRYKYARRSELQREGETTENARDVAVACLRELDTFIKAYNDISFVPLQCAVFPFVRQFRGVDPIWFDSLEFEVLHQQLQAFLVSPLFKRVMQKYPLWNAGDEPLVITY